RDFTAAIPDEHSMVATLVHAPDGSGAKLAAMVACHCGSVADGEKAVQPIKSFGSPVMDALGPIPYCRLNSILDGGYPKGALNYWKSGFLHELGDGGIGPEIGFFRPWPPADGQVAAETFHGAATRVGATDTAFPHRREGYNFLVLSQTMDP